jgi:hypothetical protein
MRIILGLIWSLILRFQINASLRMEDPDGAEKGTSVCVSV